MGLVLEAGDCSFAAGSQVVRSCWVCPGVSFACSKGIPWLLLHGMLPRADDEAPCDME